MFISLLLLLYYSYYTIEDRDTVQSYANRLAKQNGKAGIRLEIPDHLSGVHRTLLQYGHAMWEKHNKSPDYKRNIRHDDTELSFCLDLKLPGKTRWITVNYQRALMDRRASNSSEMEQMGDELSTRKEPVEVEEENTLHLAPGSLASGGSFTSTSWRAPRSTK